MFDEGHFGLDGVEVELVGLLVVDGLVELGPLLHGLGLDLYDLDLVPLAQLLPLELLQPVHLLLLLLRMLLTHFRQVIDPLLLLHHWFHWKLDPRFLRLVFCVFGEEVIVLVLALADGVLYAGDVREELPVLAGGDLHRVHLPHEPVVGLLLLALLPLLLQLLPSLVLRTHVLLDYVAQDRGGTDEVTFEWRIGLVGLLDGVCP